MMEGGPFPRIFVADIATSMTPSFMVCKQGAGSSEGTVHTPSKQDWFEYIVKESHRVSVSELV